MKYSELKKACEKYRLKHNGNLATYNALLANTKNSPDINQPEHRLAILEYLESYRCFQGVTVDAQAFSDSLLAWYQTYRRKLPSKKDNLWELSGKNLNSITELYETLRDTHIGFRGDSSNPCKIASVAASKILFTIRPKSLIHWDTKLKYEYNLNCSGSSYTWYFGYIFGEIEELMNDCLDGKVDFSTLPQSLGLNKHYTHLKLIEEYLFIQCRTIE